MAVFTTSGSIPLGAASSSTRVVSRNRPHADHNTKAPTSRETTGSHPLLKESAADVSDSLVFFDGLPLHGLVQRFGHVEVDAA